MNDDNSACERCKGTAIDPEHSTPDCVTPGEEEPGYLEPCIACQYPEVPMRPVTDEEIEALPIVSLADLVRRLGPSTPAADATEEQQ